MPRLLEEWRVPRSCAVPSADMGCPWAIGSPLNTQRLPGKGGAAGRSPGGLLRTVELLWRGEFCTLGFS